MARSPVDAGSSRLYNAGDLGSIWGFLYQGGGNLAECLELGRMAGPQQQDARR
jgi:hypothetical protein